jgi:prevent-host-death family protein
MRMASETISLTDLRPRLSELVERANARFDRFVITKHGRAEAVLMAADELDGLLETIEILSDERLVRRLVEAEAGLDRGEGFALSDLRAELDLEAD